MINEMTTEIQSHIGLGETLGPNHNYITDWYADQYGYVYRAAPWCAMYIVYCARHVGIEPDIIPSSAYTPSILKWYRDRGLVTGSEDIRVGDLVLYDYIGGDRVEHIGYVIAVDRENGYFTSVEGNWNNHVTKLTRRIADNQYFCHPQYKETQPLEEEMPSVEEIAAAVWGHVIPEKNGIGPASASDWLVDARILAGYAAVDESDADEIVGRIVDYFGRDVAAQIANKLIERIDNG